MRIKTPISSTFSLLLLLLLLNPKAQTQALAFQTPSTPPPSTNTSPTKIQSKHRRTFLTNTLALVTTCCITTTITKQEAQALQERNEALCGTGFFEHFNEFKCTAIGDISDEGTTKELSEKDVERVDGLMGKLGMDVEIVDVNESKQNVKKDANVKSRKETSKS